MTRNTLDRSHRRLLSLAAVVTVATLVGMASPAAAATLPTLANQASSSGWPVGVAIYDTVTLASGNNPTGKITFWLFGPNDPTCSAAPLAVYSTPVNGNGFYTSASFTTEVAGTYRWTAAYSGDPYNYYVPTSCGLSSASVMVAKRTSSVSNSASPLSVAGTISTTATLSGADPTGTMTFRLYGPNNLMCAGAPVFTSAAPVSAAGDYTSGGFTPAATGTYQWVVNYSGDGNNSAAGTTCADPSSAVIVGTFPGVAVPPTALTVAASPGTVARGGKLTVTWSGIALPKPGDWMALYRAGAPDYFYGVWATTGGTASGSATLTVPVTATPGDYTVRLFANHSFLRLASTGTIVVS